MAQFLLYFVPYIVILITGSYSYYYINFLLVCLSAVDLVLFSNMDQFVLVCGCPQISLLNLFERDITILNIGIVCIAIFLGSGLYSWLLKIL